MDKMLADIVEMHRKFKVPVLDTPQIPDESRVTLRHNLIDEEVNDELIPDMLGNGELALIVDHLADSMVVLLGTVCEYGLAGCWDEIWAEVCRSNMSKVDPATGEPIFREDGKFIKPPGWDDKPQIQAILDKYIK